jgi:ribosomal protein S18 acetylase RimI-like enzyme
VTIVVEVVDVATPEVVDALNGLLPQLSSSAEQLSLSDVEEMVTAPSSTLFVARSGGVIVGTLTLVVFAIPSGQRAWIEDVVVDERARGLGAGEALTRGALDLARRLGVRTVDLTSRPSREAANAMYVKLGFEARETNVYRFSLETLNADESR